MIDWLKLLRESEIAQHIRARVAEVEDAPGERTGGGWKGSVGGQCPVQGEGTVDGLSWYFRARHDEWSFEVWRGPFREDGELPIGDPIWSARGEANDASWMRMSEAWSLIEAAIETGRGCGWSMPTMEETSDG